jgi:hypothetical protein
VRVIGPSKRKGAGRAEGVGAADAGHTAEGRLVAVDAVPGGRDADGAAAIGALGQRHQPVGDGAAAAAGRAARVLGRVERIARGAEEIVVADAAHAHGRAVGLADQDGAGLLDMLGEGAIGIRDEILAGAHAAEAGLPARLEIEQILDRRGHAVERAERVARHQRALGRQRRLAGIVEAEIDEGGDGGIALLDPCDGGVDDFDGRQLTLADAARQLGGAHIGEFVAQAHDSLPRFLPGRFATKDRRIKQRS